MKLATAISTAAMIASILLSGCAKKPAAVAAPERREYGFGLTAPGPNWEETPLLHPPRGFYRCRALNAGPAPHRLIGALAISGEWLGHEHDVLLVPSVIDRSSWAEHPPAPDGTPLSVAILAPDGTEIVRAIEVGSFGFGGISYTVQSKRKGRKITKSYQELHVYILRPESPTRLEWAMPLEHFPEPGTVLFQYRQDAPQPQRVVLMETSGDIAGDGAWIPLDGQMLSTLDRASPVFSARGLFLGFCTPTAYPDLEMPLSDGSRRNGAITLLFPAREVMKALREELGLSLER